MQPNSHTGQCTEQGTYIQTRRICLDNGHRRKCGAGRRTRLIRPKAQSRRISRPAELISQVVKNPRNVIHMGGHTTVFLKMKKAAKQVAKSLRHRKALPRDGFSHQRCRKTSERGRAGDEAGAWNEPARPGQSGGGGGGGGGEYLDVIPKWPEPQCSHHYACACCRVGSSGYTLSLA